MICKILMVFAEFERASIINRIRDAYEKRSDMGLYPGGKKVYGYDLEEAVISGVKTKRFVCDVLVKAVIIAENGDPEIIWNI